MWATNAKIVGIVLGTLALYTLIANKIPQVQSEVPQALTLGANVTPEQLVAAGEKVYTGIGGCTTCHGLGERAPNLLTDEKGQGTIGARCGKREPGKTCKQYLYESLDNPTAYVVSGYQPIMPVMTKQLSPAQVWSVIAFLESQGGTVDVTASDIPTTSPASPTSPTSPGGGGGAGGAAFAGEELRHHDERGPARSAGAVSGGAQMSSPLRPAIRRYAEHPFWQAVGILLLAYIVVVGVVPILPGSAIVPKSVVLQYMITVLVGVLIYVSDNEERWRQFKEPIQAVLVEPRLKVVRAVVVAGVTALVGLVAYGQVKTTVAAPPNLRSIHPAPPAEITFRGKTITLTGLENPLRRYPDSLPSYLAEGKRVYYQNCLPCHGDHLDGQGHFAPGFNPLPANFQDNGTIAQLTESFVFWRVAKGGPGLPREGTPWNSAMPVWEDFLTEREIWSVILFLYEQTGWTPRTWEKSVSGEK
ncbi:MAG: hypothetical protein DMD56_01575 [Gemmatimonadetes bacterium]|nr:MAG: hypothetical protein DMD56_01575 [Gemmatimonadota bacterium]